jgi:hypothetical protein
MNVSEMLEYVADCNVNGFRLTPKGRIAALEILQERQKWTDDHVVMYKRLKASTEEAFIPFKFQRVATKTRLWQALDLAKKLTKKTRKTQRRKLRIKAHKEAEARKVNAA